jgi:cyclopropane-fatty-acyl-phospholipid synthase
MLQFLIHLAERGWLPDRLIRYGVRRLVAARSAQEAAGDDLKGDVTARFSQAMRSNPLVVAQADANRQHYEFPTWFFAQVLGARLKYSCGWWPTQPIVDALSDDQVATHLNAAQEAMLELIGTRAEVADGMRILDLGCGWGSLSLWLAEKFPHCTIHAVSNSQTQREHIEENCQKHGYHNVTVTTANVAQFEPSERFDRVLSVEMFEHMRNYELLLKKIASWLRPEGKLFVHLFCHAQQPYYFEDRGSGDWMTRHFFTGGLMPSRGLLREFSDDLQIASEWTVNGRHYQQTSEAWLRMLDASHASLRERLAAEPQIADAAVTLQRWRMFFIACAELFGAHEGQQWHVEHYLLQHAQQPAAVMSNRSMVGGTI